MLPGWHISCSLLNLEEFFSIIKVKEMSKKSRCILIFLILFAFLINSPRHILTARSMEEMPRPGGTLRVRAFADVFKPRFDPATDPNIFIIEHLYDGLVKLDKNFNIIPSLAEYWVISDNGKKYTFFLRKGVTFHHGKELRAEDVKFTLERLVHKETASPYCQLFISKVKGAYEYWEGKAAEVTGFKAKDPYTFEIEWKSPYVSALYLLSMSFCKILPRDQVLAQGESFFRKPSGTGPFKFDHWLRSPRLDIVGVRLERNGNYFGKKPYLDAVEFSPHYTLDHFIDKEIDIIPYLSEKLASTDCQILENDSFNIAFLGMSMHIPPLNNPAVRKAISFAINKRKIAEVAFSVESVPLVTDNYIPAKLPGFFPRDESDSYNVDKARRILEEEGYTGDTKFPALGLFLEEPKKEKNIRIFRELRDQLSVLGIRLRSKSFHSIEEVKTSKEPFLILLEWMMDFPDPENIARPLFFSKSIMNVFHYANPRLDGLLDRADVERSWTERIALFYQIEKILTADIPAIPLFSSQQRIALQPYVRGVKTPPLSFFYLDCKEIWLDK